MSTKMLEKKVKDLSSEVAELRSFVMNIVERERDPEDEYRPDFIKRVRKVLKERLTITFQGKGSLLKQLCGIK